MTLLSIHAQREHSLVTGEARRNPQHPLRNAAGAIRIGNRRIIVEPVRYHTIASLNAAEDARRDEWNATKQQTRAHECGAVAIGEYCPHAVNSEPVSAPAPAPVPANTGLVTVIRRVA